MPWLINHTSNVNEQLHNRALLEHAQKIGHSKMAWLKTDQKFLARTPLSALSHENLGSLIPLLSGLKYTYNKL